MNKIWLQILASMFQNFSIGNFQTSWSSCLYLTKCWPNDQTCAIKFIQIFTRTYEYFNICILSNFSYNLSILHNSKLLVYTYLIYYFWVGFRWVRWSATGPESFIENFFESLNFLLGFRWESVEVHLDLKRIIESTNHWFVISVKVFVESQMEVQLGVVDEQPILDKSLMCYFC